MANRSIRHLVGHKDLPVVVRNFEIATDFVILEMDEPRDLLILGRSFLSTAGASIDVKERKIKLKLGDETLKLDINKAMKKPTIQGKAFSVYKLDDLSEELLEEITTEDLLQKALSVKQSEFGVLDPLSKEYERILDRDEISEDETMLLELKEAAHAAEMREENKHIPNQYDDWNELRVPNIELKDLPHGLKYEFLGSNSTYPVIVSDSLLEEQLMKTRKG